MILLTGTPAGAWSGTGGHISPMETLLHEMKATAADKLVQVLEAWGVDTVFGLPGDGINGIMESLRKVREKIRFIQLRHESSAAFAAVGYAKFSGKLGVCLSTTGPGATNLLTGLYDAKMDQIPVLAITGLPYHDLIGTYYQQDVPTDRLFSDVAVYSERIMGPMHVETVTNHAIRAALSCGGVAHIAFPNDFQDEELEEAEASRMNQPGHTSASWSAPCVVPMQEDVERAAAVLNESAKVAIVVGAGARGARKEVEELADLLDAPVAKALLGKDVLPDDSPFTTCTIGVFGTSATGEVMKTVDTVFLVGTSFPYISYLPDARTVRGVQIDRNPERIGLRFPVEVGLVGDASATLRMLLPLLKRKTQRGLLAKAQSLMKEWWGVMEKRSIDAAFPMRPQAVSWELNNHLRDDAIVIADSGTNTLYAARQIKVRGQQRFSCSGMLASMGCGLPYAIGAQLAFPNRQVVAIVGDGGLSMVMAELSTCVKYRLPVRIIVFKNNTLGMIRWEQMMFMGNPEYGTELQNIDFAMVAEACGVAGLRVERYEELPKVFSEVDKCEGPVLVEATVDPDEPLMPGTLKQEQADNYARALRRGQPNAKRIGVTLFRDVVEDVAQNAERLSDALKGGKNAEG